MTTLATVTSSLDEKDKRSGFKGQEKIIDLKDGRSITVTCDTWTYADLLGEIKEGWYHISSMEIEVGWEYKDNRGRRNGVAGNSDGYLIGASMGHKSIARVWIIGPSEGLSSEGVLRKTMHDMPTHVAIHLPNDPRRQMPAHLAEAGVQARMDGAGWLVLMK